MLRYAAVIALGIVAPLSLHSHTALAQAPVASVNGDPITTRDVEQRMKISGTLFRKPMARPAAIQELIDDRVKLAEGKRQGMRVTPAGIEEMMSRLASSVRQTPAQFEQNLIKAGIDPEAVRAKLMAETVWSELQRQKARTRNISNAELNDELDKRVAKGEATVTDYVVRQVIFVVPPGTSAGQRERDANAARGRFTDCETGVENMRQLRDVAIKERIGRTSSELPKALNDMLQKTALGRLTPTYKTEQGVEMLAVCEKNQREDKLVLRSRIEQELLQKQASGTSGAFLNELKAKAIITR